MRVVSQQPVSSVGVEHELRIWSGRHQLDFRELLPDVAVGLRALDPGDPRARRLPSGVALTADGREAELATPPLPWGGDVATCLDDLLAVERAELAARVTEIAGASALTGFSTHVNVSVPDARVAGLATSFAHGCGLATALVAEPRSSSGLLVRPRRGRLEVCGEYAEGQHLVALVTFVGSAVAALLDGAAPPRLPQPVVVPAREKFGSFLPPEGVYADLLSDPRPDGLEVLAAAWAWARPWCVRGGLDPAVIDRLLDSAPLRCEDMETPPEACTLRPEAGVSASLRLSTGPRRRPGGIDGETLWLTWRHVVWQFTDGPRQVLAVLPVEEEQRFLDDLDSGEYDDLLRRELARRWRRRTLLVHAQVDDAVWWHDVRPGALVPAERTADGEVPRVSVRDAARAHRAQRRNS